MKNVNKNYTFDIGTYYKKKEEVRPNFLKFKNIA